MINTANTVSLKNRSGMLIQRQLRRVQNQLFRWGFSEEHSYNESTLRIMKQVRPHTMTSDLKVGELLNAINYVTANSIPGAIVGGLVNFKFRTNFYAQISRVLTNSRKW